MFLTLFCFKLDFCLQDLIIIDLKIIRFEILTKKCNKSQWIEKCLRKKKEKRNNFNFSKNKIAKKIYSKIILRRRNKKK